MTQFNLTGHIKKLSQLQDLLSDPEIAAVARRLLVAEQPETAAPRRKQGRKHGALQAAALETVKKSETPLSAKDVRAAMEAKGFAFSAVNRNVAVSKVLRTLAKQNKIAAETGDKPKSPILYRRRGVSLVPVRENVQ